MTIDMEAAREGLVEEARELLVAMEYALLQIQSSGNNPEAINAIFRAAHTIKGAAGLFAFDGVVSFTHIVESLLDRVRNGGLELDEAMRGLLLECGDYIGSLITAIEQRNESEEPDSARRSALVSALNAYLGSGSQVLTTKEPPPPPGTLHVEANEASTVGSDNWHISLRFNSDILRFGLDPISFIHYLSSLGRIVYIHTLTDALPPMASFDPEVSYLGYEIDFKSDASRKDIENVFEFVREESQIRIVPPHSKIDEYLALIDQLTEADDKLGEILVKGGALTEYELAALLDIQKKHLTQRPLGAIIVDQDLVSGELVSAALSKQKQITEKRSQDQKFIKVDASKLDKLIDLVGELVIAGAGANLAAKLHEVARFEEVSLSVSALVEKIRDVSLTLRMVPIGEVFQRFMRVVHDVSRDLDKEISLVITGADTELDKSMVEKLADPLTHIVRNAMDHGIETPEERLSHGKPGGGVIRMNAFHESGSIVIEVADDGRGLNKERIFSKAVERGLIQADQKLSDREIFNLIFEAGFSTAEQVTNLSGRGVGMDVVRKNIESLRGEVEMVSELGQGTMVRIRLPLTLAIIDGFQVVVNSMVYVIPLELVVECIEFTSKEHQQNIIKLRGEPLPFIRLREVFGEPRSTTNERENLVVVQYGQQRAGLVVDRLEGEFQAVIKPLGELFTKMKGIGGSTILGNGKVALILDIPHIIEKARNEAPKRIHTESQHGSIISKGENNAMVL